MKVLIVLAVVAFTAVASATLTPEQIEKAKQISTECETESQVDPELITKFRNGDITDDAKLKEHLFCFNKKIGTQDTQGKWNNGKLEKYLGSRFSAEVIQQCAVEKSSPQESAFEAAKCFRQNLPARH